jgi:hypothetical protein
MEKRTPVSDSIMKNYHTRAQPVKGIGEFCGGKGRREVVFRERPGRGNWEKKKEQEGGGHWLDSGGTGVLTGALWPPLPRGGRGRMRGTPLKYLVGDSGTKATAQVRTPVLPDVSDRCGFSNKK